MMVRASCGLVGCGRAVLFSLGPRSNCHSRRNHLQCGYHPKVSQNARRSRGLRNCLAVTASHAGRLRCCSTGGNNSGQRRVTSKWSALFWDSDHRSKPAMVFGECRGSWRRFAFRRADISLRDRGPGCGPKQCDAAASARNCLQLEVS